MNSRFLLALYETNASLERGGASDSDLDPSFSLNSGGADGVKSPDLPEFLTSLAGPVHIILDDDVELLDSETGPGIGSKASIEVEIGCVAELTGEGGQQV